jgi:hypothetical protein
MNVTFIANVNRWRSSLHRRNNEDGDAASDTATTADFAVGRRVHVYPGSSDERSGIIVDDFGDDAGYRIDIGAVHIADAARRWAVALDDGNLVFVDSFQLANNEGHHV